MLLSNQLYSTLVVSVHVILCWKLPAEKYLGFWTLQFNLFIHNYFMWGYCFLSCYLINLKEKKMVSSFIILFIILKEKIPQVYKSKICHILPTRNYKYICHKRNLYKELNIIFVYEINLVAFRHDISCMGCLFQVLVALPHW